jgi:hypothetical protein
MNDLNIIVNILSNYYNHQELEPAEMEMLCEWLSESQANEDFLTDLSNDANWIRDSNSVGAQELIRSKLNLLYRHHQKDRQKD